MDALRLHKNMKWGEIGEKSEDGVRLYQTVDEFIFEEKYEIKPHTGRHQFHCVRHDDNTLEVEERQFTDEDGDIDYDYKTFETELVTYLPENVTMKFVITSVSEVRNSATIFVSIVNETFNTERDYDVEERIEVDFDTFKLKNREIGKVRSLIKNAYTKNEQLLQEIENMKGRIQSYERSLVSWKESLSELTKKYASLNPIKEVA